MTDQQPSDPQKELLALNRHHAEREHDRNTAFTSQLNEAAIKNADLGLRTLVLINGGAAVSVLAFIGGLASQNRIEIASLRDVASSLMLFSFGVVVAVIGMLFSYYTNFTAAGHAASYERLWEHPYSKAGPTTPWWTFVKLTSHALAVAAAIGSLIFFVYGMFDVRNAIGQLKPVVPYSF